MRTFGKLWLGIGFLAIGIGIGILIIAFASGANWEEVSDAADFTSMNKSYDGVESLDLDVSYGSVRLVEGNNFNISADNILEGEVDSYVKNGIWYIREDESRADRKFGFDFQIRKLFYWSDHFAPEITITVPEGFEARNCSIRVNAGEVYADVVNATEGDFHVDAGVLQIDRLTVSEKSQYKVGTGEMVLDDVVASNIFADCGIGDLEINGKITGDSTIKCGVGNVDLKIDGSENDYEYEFDCGIGDIDIDGDSYRDIDSNEDKNPENNLYLNCGIGNISVDFN